jgi:hypothetical protein
LAQKGDVDIHNVRKDSNDPWKHKKSRTAGDDLLSQRVAPPVPSALTSLTAGFGMGPGVTSSLQSPAVLLFGKDEGGRLKDEKGVAPIKPLPGRPSASRIRMIAWNES